MAAVNSPTECPATAWGVTPSVSRSRVRATPTEMSAVDCEQGEVLRHGQNGWTCGAARTYLGSLDMPGTYSGTPSSWVTFSPRTGIGFSFNDYNQYLSQDQTLNVRLCALYTDSGSGSGGVAIRFRDHDGSANRWSTTLPTTASGSATMQSRCSAWAPLSGQTNCTYSWSNTCVAQVTHTQDRYTIISRVWWEFSGV